MPTTTTQGGGTPQPLWTNQEGKFSAEKIVENFDALNARPALTLADLGTKATTTVMAKGVAAEVHRLHTEVTVLTEENALLQAESDRAMEQKKAADESTQTIQEALEQADPHSNSQILCEPDMLPGFVSNVLEECNVLRKISGAMSITPSTLRANLSALMAALAGMDPDLTKAMATLATANAALKEQLATLAKENAALKEQVGGLTPPTAAQDAAPVPVTGATQQIPAAPPTGPAQDSTPSPRTVVAPPAVQSPADAPARNYAQATTGGQAPTAPATTGGQAPAAPKPPTTAQIAPAEVMVETSDGFTVVHHGRHHPKVRHSSAKKFLMFHQKSNEITMMDEGANRDEKGKLTIVNVTRTAGFAVKGTTRRKKSRDVTIRELAIDKDERGRFTYEVCIGDEEVYRAKGSVDIISKYKRSPEAKTLGQPVPGNAAASQPPSKPAQAWLGPQVAVPAPTQVQADSEANATTVIRLLSQLAVPVLTFMAQQRTPAPTQQPAPNPDLASLAQLIAMLAPQRGL